MNLKRATSKYAHFRHITPWRDFKILNSEPLARALGSPVPVLFPDLVSPRSDNNLKGNNSHISVYKQSLDMSLVLENG